MFVSQLFRGGVIAAAMLAGVAAHGQTPAAASAVAPCPHRPVSVYFASGESSVSLQAQALTTRVGEAASACEPDQIDLIASVDGAEGAVAITLALERLASVARELVASGVPASRIRAAAQPVSGTGRGLHQIDIIFRKTGDAAYAAEDVQPIAPPPAAPVLRRGDPV